MTLPYVHGPLISSSDIDFHTSMFEQVFAMHTVGNDHLDCKEVNSLFGLQGQNAITTVMQSSDTRYGVRIIEFDLVSNETIRHRSKGLLPNAAKVIDFFAGDFQPALDKAEQFGIPINDDIAKYEMAEGTVLESHAWIKDEIVCAIIDASEDMKNRFSTITDKTMSEPQSISGPTTKAQETIDCLRDVLGFKVLYEYEIKGSNFGDMLGSQKQLDIKARNIGYDSKEPYIGLIGYESASVEGLVEEADPVLSKRGLLGITVVTDDLAGVYQRAQTREGQDNFRIVCKPTQAELAPWGLCEALFLQAPNGMFLHVVQPQDT